MLPQAQCRFILYPYVTASTLSLHSVPICYHKHDVASFCTHMLPQARCRFIRYPYVTASTLSVLQLTSSWKIKFFFNTKLAGWGALLTEHLAFLYAHCRLVDQAVQAAVAESSVHLFADAAVESGEPIEVVVTPTGSSNIHQHQHRKRKERYESCNSQSQERKVIRYVTVTFVVRGLSVYLKVFNIQTRHSNRHNWYTQLNDKPGHSQLQNHIWSSR